jgi:formylglycine-generating enzyme required for sulfatase activity
MAHRRAATAGPTLIDARGDMVWVPGGTFWMGSDRHYPEEAPTQRVSVGAFWMDRTPVTNAQFRDFVESTGYVTVAELPAEDGPSAVLQGRVGSLVFTPPRTLAQLRDWSRWWEFRCDASWRRPYGPGSSIDGRDDHPVVHVSYADAEAYARWAGRMLPTEAEWEFAARAGLDAAELSWSRGADQDGLTWTNGARLRMQVQQERPDTVLPVNAFPANAYGLHDMVSNVWEWTSDWFQPSHGSRADKACCVPEDCGPDGSAVRHPRSGTTPDKVLKGGSRLCAQSYCRRRRPAARHPQPVDGSASHIGFRCVIREV